MYDADNFNYLNEVNLKKLSDGRNIIDDLLQICNIPSDVTPKHNIVHTPIHNGKILQF